jgi:hypothetical protein
MGPIECEPPSWDSDSYYRLAWVGDEVEIQRLVHGKWEIAPLEPPTDPVRARAAASTTKAKDTRLFVSHSSNDIELATALTGLVDAALEVPIGSLRCTSVAGYKLEPGANAAATLRKNLRSARVVIGLLTPSSLASAYVLMELGAAWGLKSRVVPLLTEGVDFTSIPGPIGPTLHAVRASDEGDVAALLETISAHCEMKWRTTFSRRQTLVHDFVAKVHSHALAQGTGAPPTNVD